MNTITWETPNSGLTAFESEFRIIRIRIIWICQSPLQNVPEPQTQAPWLRATCEYLIVPDIEWSVGSSDQWSNHNFQISNQMIWFLNMQYHAMHDQEIVDNRQQCMKTEMLSN